MGNPVITPLPTRVTLGRTDCVVNVENQIAGTYRYVLAVDTDSVRASLEVSVINSGTLEVDAVTYSGDTSSASRAPLFSFPTISSPVSLILKQGASAMAWVEITVVHDGTASYAIYLKGIGSGETSVSIVSSGEGSASSTSVGTSPSVVIPDALTDRSGLIIKNWTPNSILYIGYSLGEADAESGYPLVYGESLGMDVSAGVAIYGVATIPTDVRILQIGA